MNIEKQIEGLTFSDNKQAYCALKELIRISEETNKVYLHFDRFVRMMNNKENSYIRTRGLRLIAYNSKWDNQNQVNYIIESYLEHIEDDKPLTARQCIKDTVVIAKHKPEIIDIILDSLVKSNKVYEDSMKNLICSDRQKAISQIKQWQNQKL